MIRLEWLHAVKLLLDMEKSCTAVHACARQEYSNGYDQRKEDALHQAGQNVSQ